MMAGWRNCTISDICIDYLAKNHFKLFIERTYDDSENEWDWFAKRADWHLCATDPIRLVGLYIIREDWLERTHYKSVESNQEYVSVFAGICKSQELLDEYMKKDYELLDGNHSCSAFEADFQILYDEDCLTAMINSQKSDDVERIFENVEVFKTELLKQDYRGSLDKSYNVAIVIKNLKYKGEREEVSNEKFGYFKYLGVYPQINAEYIADGGNTWPPAVDKLVQWGYTVSIADDSVEFSEYSNIHIAEKNEDKYLATDPLRLLGFVAMIQEYGEWWERSDVVKSFSVNPQKTHSNFRAFCALNEAKGMDIKMMINDNSEMDKYAINKLVGWGYNISVTNENRDDVKDDVYLKSHFVWKAEKNGKIFSALDPLRLLGIVTIVQEYGDAWDSIDIPSRFSITQL